MPEVIRSAAPLRISFGGGGTDVSPYPEEKGGAVLSATIDRYAYCTLIPTSHSKIKVKSLDYNLEISYHCGDQVDYDGKLDLVKAATKVMGIANGIELFLHSDVPPGSGLGASSTLVTALIGALAEHKKSPLTLYEIAEKAYHIERVEVGIKGGKQDHYAAVFGGFNFIEFLKDKVVVNPLRIDKNTVNELEYRLLLCYSGETRISAGIIEDQVKRYVQKETSSLEALDKTKALAISMKNALLLGKINEFGELMNEAWEAKKHFSPGITNKHINDLYEVARKSGAIGGKLLGAGGGGFLLLLCEFDKWHVVAGNLEKIGGKVSRVNFESNGLRTWKVPD
jgi:D-glycero-alpha-D-manno-heptose-7-phosphate kinase